MIMKRKRNENEILEKCIKFVSEFKNWEMFIFRHKWRLLATISHLPLYSLILHPVSNILAIIHFPLFLPTKDYLINYWSTLLKEEIWECSFLIYLLWLSATVVCCFCTSHWKPSNEIENAEAMKPLLKYFLELSWRYIFNYDDYELV